MLTKSTPNTGQQNLFHSELFSQLGTKGLLFWPNFYGEQTLFFVIVSNNDKQYVI
jgi:hypothetical protein